MNSNLSNKFKKNSIRSTKYSLLTFLPVAIVYQFKRYTNFYFLCTAVIQSMPYISPLTPYSAVLPFLFVLGVSILREAVEDYQRYKSDKEINNSLVKAFKDNKWMQLKWADLKVGDIVRVESKEAFPADLIMLQNSSDEGIAYIETGSLDGEKNLKPRNVL